MIVFVDFEASSLSKQSFPLEVGWVFEDGRSMSFLIHPAPDWTDWSDEAEAIHGISLEKLQRDGASVETVARTMVETLAGHELFASAPSWDGKWLSALLRSAGFPRHALRLRKSVEAFFEAARGILGDSQTAEQIAELIADVVSRTQPSVPAHRALPDATLELRRLRRIREISRELVS